MHEIFAEGHLKSLLKSERGNLYEYNSSFTGSDQRDLEPCYLTTSHCRSKERITAAQLWELLLSIELSVSQSSSARKKMTNEASLAQRCWNFRSAACTFQYHGQCSKKDKWPLQVKEPGELSGTCQLLGGFAAHVFDFNKGFTQGMSLTFFRSPHVWVMGSQINSPFLRPMRQTLHSQIRYVLYILPVWESSGGQNEQEGLIPTTSCWAQCRNRRGQFTGLSDPHRVRLSDHSGPFWL